MIKSFDRFVNEMHSVKDFMHLIDLYCGNNQAVKDNFIKLVKSFVDNYGLTREDAEQYRDSNDALNATWGDDLYAYGQDGDEWEFRAINNFVDIAGLGSAVRSSTLNEIVYSYLLTL